MTLFEKVFTARTSFTYAHDKVLLMRKSHENSSIQKLYKSFLKIR
ncbi:MAG: iron hydrogenase small subunit [Candidatus Adiutrix intracellularis]|nr:iron hydrogenase small subunit [Candidatus Adiutrix intracellularis]